MIILLHSECKVHLLLRLCIPIYYFYAKFQRGVACRNEYGIVLSRETEHLEVRGVIKKFVDWCDEINDYKAMLTNFEGHIKQQKFYQLWKFQLYTLLNNHFIIENNLYGMFTRRSLRDVAQRHCFSMILSIFWYTFARYRKVKYQLKQSFLRISNLTNCWVKLVMFYKKGEFNLTMTAKYS